MNYKSKEKRKDYAMPILGNGSLAISVGHNGTMLKSPCDTVRTGFPTNYIWHAGRRYVDFSIKKLIPFGKFTEEFPDTDDWEQTLDTKNAMVISVCNYPFGSVISENFIHHDHNIIALRKKFNVEEEKEYIFCYTLSDERYPSLYKRRFQYNISQAKNGAEISWYADGYKEIHGITHIFSDKAVSLAIKENTLFLKTTVSPQEEICFFIIIEDDFEEENYIEAAQMLKNTVLEKGFDEILKTHKEKWNNFMEEGYAEFSDNLLTEAYKTAKYSIKSQTTKWSVPVGLSDTHWDGKFFGFDEYFSFYALLTSNHKELAKRVPTFRKNGLKVAVSRATSGSPKHEKEAFYPWEALEDGQDATIPGGWLDHIFHISHIIMGACEYYFYTVDKAFLEECYDMILCCSGYLINHTIYKTENGKTIIGKVTDLERMGVSIENAYMTTCSVICALNYTARVAEILGHSDYALKASTLAKELQRDLPKEADRYVPFPNADVSSIALFTGSYPYKVISPDDIFQKNAVLDFEKREKEFGNCYAYGNGVSTWYAAIKAASYSFMRRKEDAQRTLKQAINQVGCFAECYEINEETIKTHPWFTTAAGALVSAFNTMLLQKKGDNLYLLPSFDCDESIKFKLAADENTIVEAEFEHKRLIKLKIASDNKNLKLILPDGVKDCRK